MISYTHGNAAGLEKTTLPLFFLVPAPSGAAFPPRLASVRAIVREDGPEAALARRTDRPRLFRQG